MLKVEAAGEEALTRYKFSSQHMGTTAELTFYAADESSAKLAAVNSFARIEALDRMLSDYRPDSELRRLTAETSMAYRSPVRVSDDLACILEIAQALGVETDGAFDVTVGPLTRLWRRARRRRELPNPERLSQVMPRVSFHAVRLDRAQQTVALAAPNMRLDLGGIAKGYAADAALTQLQSHGIASALVNLGGDLALGAAPPGEAGWQVDVAPLRGRTPVMTLELHGCGVATSGDATQGSEINGTRYSHIIDPRTGMAITDAWAVTVIAETAVEADGLASAACVLGPDAGSDLVEAHRASACFAQPSSEGADLRKTPTFPSLPLRTGNELSYPR